MLFSILILLVAIHVMRKCASSFDIAASYLTRNLGEGIKGPTINAVASSLPELLISSMFLFYFKDIKGFSAGYGTIIGSSAFNIALIPVISFVYLYITKGKEKVYQINKQIVKQDALFLLGSISILSLGFFIGVNFYLASLLILFYFVYIFYVLKTRVGKKDDGASFFKKFIKDHNLELSDKIIHAEAGRFSSSLFNFKLFRIFFKGKVNDFTSTLVVLISVFIIGGSCYLLVLATENISHILGVNLFFGAFIIAAIASSIPDTIFSVQDAKNDKFIDSFSNAYGSNIFDICIGIGLPVLVYSSIYGPINMNMPIERMGWIGDYVLGGNLFMWSLLILFFFTVLVSLIYYYKRNLTLKTALLIFFLYLSFVITLLIF
jgi:cation:H+ antiporter